MRSRLQLSPWALPTLWIAIILLQGLMVTPSQAGLARCDIPPSFRVNGVTHSPVEHGKITMVALLTNTCIFCIRQAISMERNKTDLARAAGNNLHIRIVDAGPPPLPYQNGTFQSIVSFDVYQDDSNQTIWKRVYGGRKDDILVFNRCGMLTYRLQFPYSYMGYRFIYRALRYTHQDSTICPECQNQEQSTQAQDIHSQMMGDAPASARSEARFHSHSSHRRRGHPRRMISGYRQGRRGNSITRRHRRMNRGRCPRNDRLCRE